MKFTYYGHSCFEVEVAEKRLLFDPFITQNQLATKVDIRTLKPDYIFLSHGHVDHVDDVETIARSSGALLIGCYEVIEWFRKKGLEKNRAMNIGGSCNFDFGSVTMTLAIHSSSMPDGSYGGQSGGFLIKTAEGSFYYSGDTALTHDMKLIAAAGPLKVALLCIGDNFTMGVEDAVTAASWIGCQEIIGVHYNTFPAIEINPLHAQAVFQQAGCRLHLIPIGETIVF
jgi:L-ascorbate metabolism protein UlaG (beta-lactamase superfamily)